MNYILCACFAVTERYRLQSDDFASMWPLLNELLHRLSSYFRAGTTYSDFQVSYEGPLPLQEYFDVLDAHFEVCTSALCVHGVRSMG